MPFDGESVDLFIFTKPYPCLWLRHNVLGWWGLGDKELSVSSGSLDASMIRDMLG